MKSSWLWLAIVVLTLAFMAGCGGAQQKPAAPPEPPAVEEPPAPPPPPTEAEVKEEVKEKIEEMLPQKEADVEPTYEPQQAQVTEQPPPPRAMEETQPPAMAEEAPPPQEAYVAAVEAPPQPMAAAPDFEIVYFDFDKSNIKPEFEQAIANNAEKLRADSSLVVIIEGHCDERGTTEYNLALGDRRANSVKNALLSAGVKAEQLDTVSYGEERPVAMGHDETSWSQNRRAAMTIR